MQKMLMAALAAMVFVFSGKLPLVASAQAQVVDASPPAQARATGVRSAIYRFYNATTGAHFFTISAAERDSVIANLKQFRYEGPVFYAYTQPASDLSPVYRFYNTQTNAHFYTISAGERDAVIANYKQFNYEGPVWYARTNAGDGATPLYRFFRSSNSAHFYTMDLGERDAIRNTLPDFRYEGPVYWVWSSATDDAGPKLAVGGMLTDTYNWFRWSNPNTKPWNSIPDLVDHGFAWARVGVTTLSFPELRTRSDWYNLQFQNGNWSSLEVSGALLREAASQGMRLQAMLYLSDQAANAGVQKRPAAWAGLTDAEVAAKVEEHALTVATYYKSLGLNIEVFEIGNEIDFGVCGWLLGSTVPVPAGVDPVNDPVWMRDNLWVKAAPLLRAGIRGVKAVYPDAKILLHVSGFGYSKNNVAATGFFQSMLDLGVPFDIAGYSYPYMYGGPTLAQPYFSQPEFAATLASTAALGKAVQIVEFAYQASPGGATQAPAAAYPFTPEGQAAYIHDFAAAVRGKVEAIHYFYPDWYPGLDASTPNLEGGGLFASPSIGRPALDRMKAISQNRF